LQPARLCSLVACLAFGASFAPAGAASVTESVSPAGLRLVRALESDATRTGATLDREAYRAMASRRRIVLERFPLPGRAEVTLELTRFDLLGPDARMVAVDASGPRVAPPPDFRAFRGTVAGDPHSRVTLSLFGGRLAGSVRTGGEEFVVAPESYAPGDPDGTLVEIRAREADLDRPEGPFCPEGVEHPPARAQPEGPLAAGGSGGVGPDTVLRAGVAIDATYPWFERFGSLAAAQSYILNIMAQVSTIYENEVGVEIEVPYLRVFTTAADPYRDTTDASALLADLRGEWNANQTGVARTTTHLFSVRPSGGVGVAYLDVLCNHSYWPGSSYDYGVSTLSAFGGSWEKDLVAHELGHNFSSPHTHCYSPEIDRCANEAGCWSGPVTQSVGTIMSYCNQTVSSFHPRVEDERIRPAAEAAYGVCVTAAPTAPPPPPQNLTVE